MRCDYWSELVDQEEKALNDKIRACSEKSSQRARWMERELPQLLRRECGGTCFQHTFERISVFYHLFAAEGRKTGDDTWKEDIRIAYRRIVAPEFEIPEEMQRLVSALGLYPEQIKELVLSSLPIGSFIVRFTFHLRRPYLSKDDTSFHILDNPVRKEKVFGLPMVASTQWKGALRAAMTYQLADWWSNLDGESRLRHDNYRQFVTRRVDLLKLLGSEKEVTQDGRDLDVYLDQVGGKKLARLYRRYVRRFIAPNGFRAGYLRFFPTFFHKIGLEVINPHERATRVGKQPIYIESVPEGTTGDFVLLHVPFDCAGKDSVDVSRQVGDALEMVGEGLQAMFARYGFGAKTSSGFGVANECSIEEGAVQGNLGHRNDGGSPDFRESFATLDGMKQVMKDLASILSGGAA